MKVGIIGLGAIGSEVATAAATMTEIDALLLYDLDPDAASTLRHLERATFVDSADEVIAGSDLIIECANKAVVQGAVLTAVKAGKKAMVLTVGAFADDKLRESLIAAARQSGGKIYVPTGAVMGIDGVRAAAEGGISSVTLVTTKPNEGLDRSHDKWTLLFNGSAREAVKQFPKNVNVAATLSMAGLGFDKTWVQVAADPLATRNSHKIIVDGAFGRARIEVENLPSPGNPRTSALASLSTISLLRRIVSPLEIGS